MDRAFALDDRALRMLVALALVLLDHLDAFHNHPLFVGQNRDDLAALAALGPGQDHDFVAFFHVKPSHNPQRTSGASEMIFMNFLARSSRATGPKIRVPTGSSWLLRSTALLPSKRMYVPSERAVSFLVRTTTAFITSPFLTLAVALASLMDTTIT